MNLYQVNRSEYDILQYIIQRVVSEIKSAPDETSYFYIFSPSHLDTTYLNYCFNKLLSEKHRVHSSGNLTAQNLLEKISSEPVYEYTQGNSRIKATTPTEYYLDLLHQYGHFIGLNPFFRVIDDIRDWHRITKSSYSEQALWFKDIAEILSIMQDSQCVWHHHIQRVVEHLLSNFPQVAQDMSDCMGSIFMIDMDKYHGEDRDVFAHIFLKGDTQRVNIFMDKSDYKFRFINQYLDNFNVTEEKL